MNYVKAYLKRNKMTREQLAKMVIASMSLVNKVSANGKYRLNPRIKRIMELEEINKKLEAMVTDLKNIIERLKSK